MAPPTILGAQSLLSSASTRPIESAGEEHSRSSTSGSSLATVSTIGANSGELRVGRD
ncbi:hypothetical protein [Promicromonospora iranensis]|uniref:hypothetical protein n=1 Tax=Promicromonospora iranensis TaxID=1105144 RepID=UPI0023A982B4|nr:hypothetical protein [Promicromonospora iranensis]